MKKRGVLGEKLELNIIPLDFEQTCSAAFLPCVRDDDAAGSLLWEKGAVMRIQSGVVALVVTCCLIGTSLGTHGNAYGSARPIKLLDINQQKQMIGAEKGMICGVAGGSQGGGLCTQCAVATECDDSVIAGLCGSLGGNHGCIGSVLIHLCQSTTASSSCTPSDTCAGAFSMCRKVAVDGGGYQCEASCMAGKPQPCQGCSP